MVVFSFLVIVIIYFHLTFTFEFMIGELSFHNIFEQLNWNKFKKSCFSKF